MGSVILVTGALGNVGAEIVKQLQAKGRKVRAADIDERKLKEQLIGKKPITFRQYVQDYKDAWM